MGVNKRRGPLRMLRRGRRQLPEPAWLRLTPGTRVSCRPAGPLLRLEHPDYAVSTRTARDACKDARSCAVHGTKIREGFTAASRRRMSHMKHTHKRNITLR